MCHHLLSLSNHLDIQVYRIPVDVKKVGRDVQVCFVLQWQNSGPPWVQASGKLERMNKLIFMWCAAKLWKALPQDGTWVAGGSLDGDLKEKTFQHWEMCRKPSAAQYPVDIESGKYTGELSHLLVIFVDSCFTHPDWIGRAKVGLDGPLMWLIAATLFSL